jgi:hypothetical protein
MASIAPQSKYTLRAAMRIPEKARSIPARSHKESAVEERAQEDLWSSRGFPGEDEEEDRSCGEAEKRENVRGHVLQGHFRKRPGKPPRR